MRIVNDPKDRAQADKNKNEIMRVAREKVHEELMEKLFKKNHPYASLERSQDTIEREEFTPVVQVFLHV